MAGLDLLNINLSVVYQITLFLLTIVMLSKWVIGPITATLALRRQRLIPVDQDTDLEKSVLAKEEEYSHLLHKIRSDSAGLRHKIRDAAETEELAILDTAFKAHDKRLTDAMKLLHSSIDEVKNDMDRWIPEQAKALARKILGREL